MVSIFGKKMGMTTYFSETGDTIPVTVIEASPCYITQIKTKEKDGYEAVQFGFGTRKEKNVKKPQLGKLKKLKLEPVRYFRELRDYPVNELKEGDKINVDIFNEGDTVKVIGISKGKGFQGVVRRHGFGGGSKTHGQSDRMRAPGSIGASSYPSRVFKGQRMAGRMGNDRISISNLKVIKVLPDSNLILINGPVPGAKTGIVQICK